MAKTINKEILTGTVEFYMTRLPLTVTYLNILIRVHSDAAHWRQGKLHCDAGR